MCSGHRAQLWALRWRASSVAMSSCCSPSIPPPLYVLFQSQAPARCPDHLTQIEVLKEVQCPLPGRLEVFPYLSCPGWLHLVPALFPQYLTVRPSPTCSRPCLPSETPIPSALPQCYSKLPSSVQRPACFTMGLNRTAGHAVFIRQLLDPEGSCGCPDCTWNFRRHDGQDRGNIMG